MYSSRTNPGGFYFAFRNSTANPDAIVEVGNYYKETGRLY
jgi:hypothetical protein